MTEQPQPVQLTYESAAAEPIGRRPRWVWVVIGAYVAVCAFVLLLPLWVQLSSPGDNGPVIGAAIGACLFTLCGFGLLFTPVRIARRRPITRGNVWIPIIASGLLAGLLFLGASLALLECLKLDEEWMIPMCIFAGLVWFGWAILFWLMTSSRAPESVARWLHHTLFAGSVAELLIAVPCHVIVRRRGECCGGILTGTGICIGCIVMVLSLGPSVGFLYYRRWKQISKREETAKAR